MPVQKSLETDWMYHIPYKCCLSFSNFISVYANMKKQSIQCQREGEDGEAERVRILKEDGYQTTHKSEEWAWEWIVKWIKIISFKEIKLWILTFLIIFIIQFTEIFSWNSRKWKKGNLATVKENHEKFETKFDHFVQTDIFHYHMHIHFDKKKKGAY